MIVLNTWLATERHEVARMLGHLVVSFKQERYEIARLCGLIVGRLKKTFSLLVHIRLHQCLGFSLSASKKTLDSW